jgi:hypothetical protein
VGLDVKARPEAYLKPKKGSCREDRREGRRESSRESSRELSRESSRQLKGDVKSSQVTLLLILKNY